MPIQIDSSKNIVIDMRGNDISYVPVVLSYLALTKEECIWFVQEEVVTEELRNYLKENNIISSDKMLKTYKRHKDRDGSYVSIVFCGRKQVGRILHYLYDNTDIYIPRKYQKFQDMKEFFND